MTNLATAIFYEIKYQESLRMPPMSIPAVTREEWARRTGYLARAAERARWGN